jgi:phospholipid/cholesterol/gamma-HCH transport system substrate-binding protein
MKTRNLNDWAVALIVIACSIVLFLALAFALSGKMLGSPSRSLRVNFHDVTGISLGSQVRFAGANAGRVASVRMLTPEERSSSGDPLNAVQLLLALNPGVPPLPSDITVSIAADTLLSDKFVLLSGGSAKAPLLADNAILEGIPPVTFDRLTREIDSAITGLRGMLGGTTGEAGDIFESIRLLLTETRDLVASAKPILQDAQSLLNNAKPVLQDAQTLLTDAQPVVQDARLLATDARQLVAENRAPLTRTILQLDKSASAIERLATRSNDFVASNEKKLSALISDLSITSQNLKVTTTYSKIFFWSVLQRPTKLIWGTRRPPAIPSQQEILESSKPFPVN